jgi:hypothetical protein
MNNQIKVSTKIQMINYLMLLLSVVMGVMVYNTYLTLSSGEVIEGLNNGYNTILSVFILSMSYFLYVSKLINIK